MGVIQPAGQDWSQYTLVDIIGQIWTLGVATIAKVKSAAQHVFNGIKAGVEFVADIVLELVIDEVISILRNILLSLFISIAAINLDYETLEITNGFKFTSYIDGGKSIDVVLSRNNFDLELKLNTDVFSINLLTLLFSGVRETLGGVEEAESIAIKFGVGYLTTYAGIGIIGTSQDLISSIVSAILFTVGTGSFIWAVIDFFDTRSSLDQTELKIFDSKMSTFSGWLVLFGSLGLLLGEVYESHIHHSPGTSTLQEAIDIGGGNKPIFIAAAILYAFTNLITDTMTPVMTAATIASVGSLAGLMTYAKVTGNNKILRAADIVNFVFQIMLHLVLSYIIQGFNLP